MKERSSCLSCLIAIVACVSAWCVPSAFGAPAYPAKPIRLVVPFPAGGPTDTAARDFDGLLARRLGRRIVVDNRPGAAGAIGTEIVAEAPPDGYTLLLCSNAFLSVLVAKEPDRTHDPVQSFIPVFRFGETPFVLFVTGGLPASGIDDLVAAKKPIPHRLQYASAGEATLTHIAGAVLARQTKLDWVHVPYKGAADALGAAAGGHVQTVFSTAPQGLAYAGERRLRPLATTGMRRSLLLPDIPTLTEAGIKDGVIYGWAGLCAPRGTPRSVIDKLSAEAQEAYNAPDVKSRLEALGYEHTPNTAHQFAQFIRLDYGRIRELVRKYVNTGSK